MDLTRDDFEALVAAALDELPEDLGRLMRNVAVVVEDDAPEDDPDLLGLYEGVPLAERDTTYSGALPDIIRIFRGPICAMCDTYAEIVDEVRITVVHEVAHHFGIDDARLDELGW